MSRPALSSRADRDLLDIYLSGTQCFGGRQASRYVQKLEHVFQLLADNPRMGRVAPTIGIGVRRHEHAAHIILYELDADGILILAVVAAGNVEDLYA